MGEVKTTLVNNSSKNINMFNLFKRDKSDKATKKSEGVNWSILDKTEILDEIKTASEAGLVMIYKHSVTCPISGSALHRLERHWNKEEMEGLTPYYLDLLRFRDVSNQVAQVFSVRHESPQVLVIDQGKCVYHTSHMGINYEDLKKIVQD